MNAEALNQGLQDSGAKIKTWSRTAERSTDEVQQRFAKKVTPPKLPKLEPVEWQIRQRVIREEAPVRRAQDEIVRQRIVREEPVRQAQEEIVRQRVLPAPQTSAVQTGLALPLAGLSALVLVVKKVVDGFVTLAGASKKTAEVLDNIKVPPVPKPIPAIPVEPQRPGKIPEGFDSKFIPTASRVPKGQPIASKLDLPPNAVPPVSNKDKLIAWDILPRNMKPKPVFEPDPEIRFPPEPAAPRPNPLRRHKKFTPDDPTGAAPGKPPQEVKPPKPPAPPKPQRVRDARGRWIKSEFPPPAPLDMDLHPPIEGARRTTLTHPPRDKAGKFKDYIVTGDQPTPPKAPPRPIPVAELQEVGFKAAIGRASASLNVFAKQLEAGRFEKGIPVAKAGIPPQKPGVNVPSIKMPDAPLAKIAPPMPKMPGGGGPGGPGAAGAAGAGDAGAGAAGAAGGLSKMAIGAAAVTVAIGAAILIVKGLSSAFQEVAERALAARDAAIGLGVGMQGMQSIGHAAKVAGVESQTLQAALGNLQTALKSSDAEAGRVFSKLGLSFQELRKLPVDEQIARIAGALQGIADPSERARAGLAVFQGEYVKLQPFLNKGPEGLRALSAEARKLGIALDDAEAAKLLEANEAISRLSASWDGFRNSMAVMAAPAIQFLTEGLINLKGTIREIADAWTSNGTAGEGAMSKIVGAVGTAWDALVAGQGLIDKYVTAPAINAGAVVVDVFSNLASELSPVWDAIKGPASEAWEVVKMSAVAAWDGITEATAGAGIVIAEAWDGVATAVQDVWFRIKDFGSSIFDNLATPVQEAITAVAGWFKWLGEKISAAWSKIKSLFSRSKAGDSLREVGDAVEDLGNKRIDAFGSTADKMKANMKSMEDSAKKTANTLKGTDLISDLRAKTLMSINALEIELGESFQKIGRTGPEQKIMDLEKAGASKDDLKKARELAAIDKQVQAGFSHIKLPDLKQFENATEGLNHLLKIGRIDADQYSLGILSAAKQLEQAAGVGPIAPVAAQVKDSREAVSTIIRSDLQAQSQDPQQQLIRAQLEMKEIQKKQLATAEAIKKVLEKQEDEAFEMF